MYPQKQCTKKERTLLLVLAIAMVPAGILLSKLLADSKTFDNSLIFIGPVAVPGEIIVFIPAMICAGIAVSSLIKLIDK